MAAAVLSLSLSHRALVAVPFSAQALPVPSKPHGSTSAFAPGRHLDLSRDRPVTFPTEFCCLADPPPGTGAGVRAFLSCLCRDVSQHWPGCEPSTFAVSPLVPVWPLLSCRLLFRWGLLLISSSQPCPSSPIWLFPLFSPFLGSLFFFRPPAQQTPAASTISTTPSKPILQRSFLPCPTSFKTSLNLQFAACSSRSLDLS